MNPVEEAEKLLLERIGQDFEGECHLAEHEAREIVSLLRSQAERIGELERALGSVAGSADALSALPVKTDNNCVTSKGAGSAWRWPRPGDRMRFVGEHGYESEREAAMKVFRVGQVVTVRDINIGSWSHVVYFVGHDRGWNGVMFKLLSPEDADAPTDQPVGEASKATQLLRATEPNTSPTPPSGEER